MPLSNFIISKYSGGDYRELLDQIVHQNPLHALCSSDWQIPHFCIRIKILEAVLFAASETKAKTPAAWYYNHFRLNDDHPRCPLSSYSTSNFQLHVHRPKLGPYINEVIRACETQMFYNNKFLVYPVMWTVIAFTWLWFIAGRASLIPHVPSCCITCMSSNSVP